MAGKRKPEFTEEEMHQTYVENLRYASQRLHENGITALIEPINSIKSVPDYFTDSVHKAVNVIEKVKHSNLKLQLDLFHVQIMHGNLTEIITKYFSLIGHIQIAQVPDRHEPNSSGEVNYSYIFSLLEKLGYDGYIGLEYKPEGNTIDGLDWLNPYM